MYIQDFPLKTPAQQAASNGAGDSPFERSLRRYLSALALPGAHAAPLAALVRSHDYSSARGHLIPSVPGYHKGAEMDAFGHLAVKRALLGERLPSALRGAPLVAQASSLGSLNENWVQEFLGSLCAGQYVVPDGESTALSTSSRACADAANAAMK